MVQQFPAPRRQSFGVFYRQENGEGGFVCLRCSTRQAGTFGFLSGALTAARKHLTSCPECRGERSLHGWALIDGKMYPAALRSQDATLIVAV